MRTRNVIVWFSFCLWLQKSSFHWIMSAKNYWKKMEMLQFLQLPFYWAYDWALMTSILFLISTVCCQWKPCYKRTVKHKTQPLNRTAIVNRHDSSILLSNKINFQTEAKWTERKRPKKCMIDLVSVYKMSLTDLICDLKLWYRNFNNYY